MELEDTPGLATLFDDMKHISETLSVSSHLLGRADNVFSVLLGAEKLDLVCTQICRADRLVEQGLIDYDQGAFMKQISSMCKEYARAKSSAMAIIKAIYVETSKEYINVVYVTEAIEMLRNSFINYIQLVYEEIGAYIEPLHTSIIMRRVHS